MNQILMNEKSSKCGLNDFISKINKLDFDKLKPILVDLKKLSDVKK